MTVPVTVLTEASVNQHGSIERGEGEFRRLYVWRRPLQMSCGNNSRVNLHAGAAISATTLRDPPDASPPTVNNEGAHAAYSGPSDFYDRTSLFTGLDA